MVGTLAIVIVSQRLLARSVWLWQLYSTVSLSYLNFEAGRRAGCFRFYVTDTSLLSLAESLSFPTPSLHSLSSSSCKLRVLL